MERDLIFDVGMHNGDDTRYYLLRGYRVVAVEANPVGGGGKSASLRQRDGRRRLTLLDVGIGPVEGVFDFWVNDSKPDFSSLK